MPRFYENRGLITVHGKTKILGMSFSFPTAVLCVFNVIPCVLRVG